MREHSDPKHREQQHHLQLRIGAAECAGAIRGGAPATAGSSSVGGPHPTSVDRVRRRGARPRQRVRERGRVRDSARAVPVWGIRLGGCSRCGVPSTHETREHQAGGNAERDRGLLGAGVADDDAEESLPLGRVSDRIRRLAVELPRRGCCRRVCTERSPAAVSNTSQTHDDARSRIGRDRTARCGSLICTNEHGVERRS